MINNSSICFIYSYSVPITDLFLGGGRLPSTLGLSDLSTLFGAFSSAHSFQILEDFQFAAAAFSSSMELSVAQTNLDGRATYGSLTLAVKAASVKQTAWYLSYLSFLPLIRLASPDWPPHRAPLRHAVSRSIAARGLDDWHALPRIFEDVLRINLASPFLPLFIFPIDHSKIASLLLDDADLFDVNASSGHAAAEVRLRPLALPMPAATPPNLETLGHLLDVFANSSGQSSYPSLQSYTYIPPSSLSPQAPYLAPRPLAPSAPAPSAPECPSPAQLISVASDKGETFKVYPPTWLCQVDGPDPHQALLKLDDTAFSLQPFIILQMTEAFEHSPFHPVPCEIGCVDFTLSHGKCHTTFHRLIDVGPVPSSHEGAYRHAMERKHGVSRGGDTVTADYRKIWSALWDFLRNARSPLGVFPPIYAKSPARQLQMLRWVASKANVADFQMFLPPILAIEDLAELIHQRSSIKYSPLTLGDFFGIALLNGDADAILRMNTDHAHAALNSQQPHIARRCQYHQKHLVYSSSLTNDPQSKDRTALRCALADAHRGSILLFQLFKSCQNPSASGRIRT